MGNNNSLLNSVFGGKDTEQPVDIKKIYAYKLHVKTDEELTGWERIKKIFESDMYGERSPELERCVDTVLYTVIAGAFIGGIGRSRIAYQNFFRSNMHTAFETPSRAKAKLQETVLLGIGSGAFRIGWRVAVFSSVYSVGSTCCTAYRGKASVFDPAIGGALAGFLYKFREGPTLMLAGTVIGGAFGLFGGGVTNGLLSLAGTSQDDLMAQQRKQVYDRRTTELEKMQATRKPQEDKITLAEFHAEILNEEAETQKSSQPQKSNSDNINKSKPGDAATSTVDVSHSTQISKNTIIVIPS